MASLQSASTPALGSLSLPGCQLIILYTAEQTDTGVQNALASSVLPDSALAHSLNSPALSLHLTGLFVHYLPGDKGPHSSLLVSAPGDEQPYVTLKQTLSSSGLRTITGGI